MVTMTVLMNAAPISSGLRRSEALQSTLARALTSPSTQSDRESFVPL